MVGFLLWCILFILCWPLALFALILYPIVWLLLLPFRLVGIAVGGVLELVWALITLPARVIGAGGVRQASGLAATSYNGQCPASPASTICKSTRSSLNRNCWFAKPRVNLWRIASSR